MLTETVSQLLNDQVNKEFYSAYLYLGFSNYYVEQGLAGFANWYKVQAQEERDHAMLMLQYLQNNDVPVTLEAIAKPDAELQTDMESAEGRSGPRAVRHRPDPRHLRGRLRGQGLPHHAVPGLVREGTGRGGDQRRPTSSRRWSSSAPIPRASICWTRSWRPGPTPPPP